MSLTTNALLAAALEYAAQGFAVLPLHYPIINRNKTFCSCHLGAECTSIGKHPQYHETLIRHGVHDASIDEALIRDWWKEWPKANVGIATGAQSNLFVIDADSPLIVNDAEQRGLPPTPSVRTGNGQHAWFKHPGFIVPNKVKIEGFDFRGDGGLVVAPPSMHYSGVRYDWITALDTPLADCPGWISALITQSKAFDQAAHHFAVASSDQPYGLGSLKNACMLIRSARNGERNNTLYQKAASIYNLVAGGELLDSTADEALRAAGNAVGLDPEEIEKTLTQAKRNGSANPRNAPKREKAEIDLLKFSNTDIGNAERIVAMHGENIRFVGQWDTWLFWNGKYWQKDSTGYVSRLAQKMVKLLLHASADLEDEEKRKKAINFALSSHSRKSIDNMLALAKNQLGIRVDATVFDCDPWLLNCINGTLNLQSGKLQAHQQSDLITRMLDIAYNEDASAPTWLTFLNVIFANDQTLITYVQKALGYSITGDVREDCLHFAYGSGGNGKSTFFRALEKLLGDYAHKSPSSMLMASKFEGIPVDVADLQGKRLVVASEVSKGVRWNEAKIKDLTGGDKLTARYMRANPFTFEPTHKLWIYGNYKPVVIGADEGIWRRMRLIPFVVKIPAAIKDTTFDDKLVPELSGILSWIVRGCLDWQHEGLRAPKPIAEATHDYQTEMDKLQAFIDERCVVSANERCLFKELYASYVQYCKQLGEFVIDKREFKERLERKEYATKHGTGNMVVVLGIRALSFPELVQAHESAKAELTTLEL